MKAEARREVRSFGELIYSSETAALNWPVPQRACNLMAELTRTGVSLEEDLLKQFDKVIAKRGYKNRSEAIRDLIRESLVEEAVDRNKEVVATLSMVYDHHKSDLSNKLNAIQHHSHGNVLAATHVHLDLDNCLEVVIMKGRSSEVQHLADHMLAMRGVKHGKLVITTTGSSSR